VFTIAVDAEGRRRNLIEHACRVWAAERGIPCPAVLDVAASGSWLLAERVSARPAEGLSYVHAALDTADLISAQQAPSLPMFASQWRGSRRSMAARVLRGLGGGLDLGGFVRTRRAAAALTDRTTAHGDFYRRNVLSCAEDGVSIIDWEFIGDAPRWTDHLRLWSTLRCPEDRAAAWQRIRNVAVSAAKVEHLRVLIAWLSHRLLAENLAAPAAERNKSDLRHARHIVLEARSVSADLR
jgi:Phosphotransferase enzyme family